MSEHSATTSPLSIPPRLASAIRERVVALPIAAVPVIVAAGVVLRLVRYLHERSLWLDESLLALNLTTRSFGELHERLEFRQGAPLPFLYLEKAAIEVLGDGELAFRLFPLIASLAALLAFYPVAKRIVGRTAALIALSLFATMEPFIRYAAEAKPYSFDVLVTLLLVWLFARKLDPASWSRGDVAVLAAAGAVALWFSFPAVFVLAGFGLAVALQVVRARALRLLPKLALVAGAWAASWTALYAIVIRGLGTAQGVAAAKTGDPTREGSAGVVKGLYVIFSDPGELPRTLAGLVVLAAFAGIVVLAGTRPRLVGMFAAIGIVTLLAGVLDRYPLVGRFLLFLLPIGILLAAAGVAAMLETLRPRLALVGIALAALVLAPPAGSAVKHVFSEPPWEDIEPPLAYLHERWRPGDTLYVYFTSQYAFRHYLLCESCNANSDEYSRTWPIRPLKGTDSQWSPAFAPETRSIVVGSYAPQPWQYIADLERVRGRSRVWVLVSEPWNIQRGPVLEPLELAGTRLEAYESGISGVYLYDLRGRDPG